MVIQVGEIYPSNNYGDMEVVEYVNSNKVRIRFLGTGCEKYTYASTIRNGQVKDSEAETRRTGGPTTLKIGRVYPSNSYGDFEVTEYVKSNNVGYRFLATGYTGHTTAQNIRKGQVKDPLIPSVYGVGYMGDGPYKSSINRVKTKVYTTWVGMLERCYDSAFLRKCPTYIGCSVLKEWHNFQVFAEWFEENYIDGCDLDKDIKVKGNKIYGPNTCMFVTHADNSEAALAVTAVFRSPIGERVEVYNINKFAKDQGLTGTHLSGVRLGKLKQHKGWTLYKE